MAAGSFGGATCALILAAPAFSVVTCSAGRRPSVHQEHSTGFGRSPSLVISPSCFKTGQRVHGLATGGLSSKGLNAGTEAVGGQKRLFLTTGIFRGPSWYASRHDEGKAAFSFFYQAASNSESAETQSDSEGSSSLLAAKRSSELNSDDSEEDDDVAGPPAQAVPYVFDWAQELDKHGYGLRDVDPRLEDLVYTPLARELLKSWNAYPDTFESAFWDALLKLQAGQYKAYRVNNLSLTFW